MAKAEAQTKSASLLKPRCTGNSSQANGLLHMGFGWVGGFAAPDQEGVEDGEQGHSVADELPGVGFQEACGFVPQPDAEPYFAEVSHRARGDHHGEELGQRRAEDSCCDHEHFHRQRNRNQRGNENRQ